MLKKIRDYLDAAKARSDAQDAANEMRFLRHVGNENKRLYLTLLRETRSLNRTVGRQARTIKRLRAKIALEAPTQLPPLANTEEGRKLYNHAYQMGRRKGRRDQVIGNTEPVEAPTDDKAFSVDAAGLSDTPVEPVPQAAVEAVERVRNEVAVDVAVPLSANDEVSLEPIPNTTVRHLHSVPSGQDRESYSDTQDRESYVDDRPGS